MGWEISSQGLGEAVEYLFPDSAEDHAKAASYYFGKKEYIRAENNLKKAISFEPNNLNFYRKLLECYLAQEDHISALDCLRKIDKKRYLLLFDASPLNFDDTRRQIDDDYELMQELEHKIGKKVKKISDIINSAMLQESNLNN